MQSNGSDTHVDIFDGVDGSIHASRTLKGRKIRGMAYDEGNKRILAFDQEHDEVIALNPDLQVLNSAASTS